MEPTTTIVSKLNKLPKPTDFKSLYFLAQQAFEDGFRGMTVNELVVYLSSNLPEELVRSEFIYEEAAPAVPLTDPGRNASMFAPAGTYTTPSGTLELTKNFNVIGWDGNDWEKLFEIDIEIPQPIKSVPFFKEDSDLTDYSMGSIVDIGKFDYVDNGDQLFVSFLRKVNPLIQIVNNAGTVTAQYYPNNGSVASGLQEIDINSFVFPHPTLFKAIVDWDAIGSVTEFGQKLKLNTLLTYNNNIKNYTDTNFYQKTSTDSKDKEVNLLSIFDKAPLNAPSEYNVGTLIDYWVTDNYIDNGDTLFLSFIGNPRPLIQVVNQSDTAIAQYFVNDLDLTAAGIKVINLDTISYPYITLFKVKINWDKLTGLIDFGKTLQLNTNKREITKEYIDGIKTEVDGRLDDVLNKNEILERYTNLFDKTDPDILYGMWVPSDSTDGIPSELRNGSFMTGFIPVSEGNRVYTTALGKWSSGYFSMYDEDKQIITKDSIIIPDYAQDYSYTVQAGERFVRISFRNPPFSVDDIETFMVIIGRVVTDKYIPYGYKKKVDLKKIKFPNTLYDEEIAWLGDSFVEFGIMPEIMESETGAKVYNLGVGGTRLAEHQTIPIDYDAFSAYVLADAIVTGDWSRQIAALPAMIADGDDNSEILERMMSIDFNKVNKIIFSHGTNDFTGGNLIGLDSDITGSTIKGAINYTINRILTVFPHIRLLFTTPLYRNIGGIDGESCDTYVNPNGDKLIDVIKAIEEVTALHHVESLTLFNKAGINSKNFKTFSADGTHPNENGDQRYGDMFARHINSN